jgi:hypothetical protein
MFKPEVLLEKQPLIIDDNDYSITALKDSYFNINPSQSFTLTGQVNNDYWHKNKYKYVIIQASGSAGDILLCNPNNTIVLETNETVPDKESETKIVEVQLSKGQIVIVPFNWLYLISDSTVNCIGIHDYITYFLP